MTTINEKTKENLFKLYDYYLDILSGKTELENNEKFEPNIYYSTKHLKYKKSLILNSYLIVATELYKQNITDYSYVELAKANFMSFANFREDIIDKIDNGLFKDKSYEQMDGLDKVKGVLSEEYKQWSATMKLAIEEEEHLIELFDENLKK